MADPGPAGPGLAARLAEFAWALRREDVAEPAAGHTASLILDAVGCALAGWAAEETPQVLTAARALGGTGDATVIGDTAPASLIGAVLANAYLTTAVTSCDVYTPAHCHLTPEVVPAALAAAELEHASGPALLTAVAAGLETASRLLRAIGYTEFRRRGWHSPGVIGPVGAAVAAGLLFGLRPAQLRTAMSLAVSQAAGTFAAWPTTAVKFHQARGAAAGLLSACLAASGFTASAEPFEAADGGLFRSYSPGDPAAALAGLGTEWELEQISVRLWPGATPVQALLTALLGREQQLPAAGEVAAVEIRVPTATYEAHRGLAHPAGCFEALLSFHYVAAVTILHGRFDIDLTGPAHIASPDLASFIDRRVMFMPDPALPHGAVWIRLACPDGVVVDVCQEHALGTPQCPATTSQIREKFARNAAARLAPGVAADLLAGISNLNQLADCSELLTLMRQPSQVPARASRR